jgi:transposase
LDWRAKVELFEEIRREYEFGVGTIVGVAKKLKVHRRMVREAIGCALPKARKKTERPRWKIAAAAAFVDQILEADRKAPRKQRHTAYRIWQRIQKEMPECRICPRTVRQYVHDRKVELGQIVHETFVPQSYEWGVEAQVDWYDAYADLSGQRTKLQVFSMRSMASGAAFHCAFLHATQQAFLEGHELAFAFFCGVFRKLRYDNLTSAVKKILRGYRREETARFIAFRSHWRFESEFCTPGEAHEKGGVEGEAGYFRRNHWVPVPNAADLSELNRQLLAACQLDGQRCIAGREQSVGAALITEREHLLPLVAEGMDLARTSFPSVNNMACVKVLTNSYSAPLKPGTQVQAKTYASVVELWHAGRCVARHERCYSRQQQVLDLEHYLDVLSRKPGALAGSRPLEQQRRAGLWPKSFDEIWQALMTRYGKPIGTRHMIELLKLSRQFGRQHVRRAIETALATGCTDIAAVQHLVHARDLNRPACEVMDIGSLERYHRPSPVMNDYDQLLSAGEAR